MDNNVTMKMIAEKAGISIGTVDRAINNRGRISPETQKNILAIAKELQYKPNAFASILSKKTELRIVAVLPIYPDYFFEKIHKGMRDAEEDLKNYKVVVKYLHPQKLDSASQLKVMKELENEQADGIVMNPANARITSHINSFCQRGIPVVTFNSDIDASDRLFYVGPDMCQSGKVAGDLLGKFMGGQGEIMVLEADPRIISTGIRKKSFMNVIASDYPNIHVAENFRFDDEEEEARAITQRVIKDNKDIKGIFVNTAAGTVGVAKALEDIHKDSRPVVIGFDAPDYVREMVKKGIVSATVCQDPYIQGYYSIILLAKQLLEGWVPESKHMYTRQNIILKHNADARETRFNIAFN